VHAVQPAAPAVTALYVPAAHAVHPTEDVALAPVAKAPRGHAVQAADVAAPSTSLKAPGPHTVQAAAPPASVLYAPRGQAVHPWGVVAVSRLEYAPAAHAVQSEAAGWPEYVPASHEAHSTTGLVKSHRWPTPQGHNRFVVVAPAVRVAVTEVLAAGEHVGEGPPEAEIEGDCDPAPLAVAVHGALAVPEAVGVETEVAVAEYVAHSVSAVGVHTAVTPQTQTVHRVQPELPPAEKAPAAHAVQAAATEAPAVGLYVPAGHAWQPDDLTTVVYVPAAQAAQVAAPAAE